jgi:two-component system nitrogen regulation response regulator GlnG
VVGKEHAKKNVLIIDDDPSIRYMLGRVLLGEGYGVYAAADGVSGLTIAQEVEINLVMLDLKMPGKSGQETFKALRDAHLEMPVIIISAFSRQQLDNLNGANALLQKPLDFPILLDTIKRLLAEPVAQG